MTFYKSIILITLFFIVIKCNKDFYEHVMDGISAKEINKILSSIENVLLDTEKQSKSPFNIPYLDDILTVPGFMEKMDVENIMKKIISNKFKIPYASTIFNLLEPEDSFFKDFLEPKLKATCSDVKIKESEIKPMKCSGPEIILELEPPICFVIDHDTNHFECEPPRLVYYRTGPTCTSKHNTPVEFIDKQCRASIEFGTREEEKLFGYETIEKSLSKDDLGLSHFDPNDFIKHLGDVLFH